MMKPEAFMVEYVFIWSTSQQQEDADEDSQHFIDIIHKSKDDAKAAVEKLLESMVNDLRANNLELGVIGYEVLGVYTIEEHIARLKQR